MKVEDKLFYLDSAVSDDAVTATYA